MDGDGHNAKAFAWQDEADEAPARAFDPAAVLRAIEDEDEDTAPPPKPVPASRDGDLGAALRAALAFDATDDSEADTDVAETGVDAAHDDVGSSDASEPGGDRDAPEADGAVVAAGTDGERAPGEDAGDDDQFEDDPSEDHADDLYDTGAFRDGDEYDEDEDHDGDFPGADEPLAAAPMAPGFPSMAELDIPGRKPRIALMGEFSAGKSTLSNLLIGSAPLPMKVTATQLPPVWISFGTGQAYREDLDGETHPIDLARLIEIDPSETRMIRIFAESEILEMCDIIDMPGISDPNMESDVWERVIGRADAVIWCTHATQAWRQSEASVWESLDPALFEKSLLLVTRFDKLHAESDRARVMRRIERETEGLFAARLPISLTEALSAGDDEALLEKSGAAAFHRALVGLIDDLSGSLGTAPPDVPARARTTETLGRDGMVSRLDGGRPVRSISPSRILPRRVRPVSEAVEVRPRHEGHDSAP